MLLPLFIFYVVLLCSRFLDVSRLDVESSLCNSRLVVTVFPACESLGDHTYVEGYNFLWSWPSFVVSFRLLISHNVFQFFLIGFLLIIVNFVASDNISFNFLLIVNTLKDILSDSTKLTILNINPVPINSFIRDMEVT